MQILQETGPARKETKIFGENQWVISRNTASHSAVSIELNFKAEASEDMYFHFPLNEYHFVTTFHRYSHLLVGSNAKQMKAVLEELSFNETCHQ